MRPPVAPKEPPLPSPCCAGALPAPSEAARGAGPDVANGDARAFPILCITLGFLRSGDRDLLSTRLLYAMA